MKMSGSIRKGRWAEAEETEEEEDGMGRADNDDQKQKMISRTEADEEDRCRLALQPLLYYRGDSLTA
jgi:hypothetical protein